MSDVSTDNGTQRGAAAADYNFPALIFGVLLIVIIAGGNVLVCLSVYLEKALKTTTNYFIVSLAFADLLLAVLVLPLFVYAEVSAARRGAARTGADRTGFHSVVDPLFTSFSRGRPVTGVGRSHASIMPQIQLEKRHYESHRSVSHLQAAENQTVLNPV